jgi:hypothetical protein
LELLERMKRLERNSLFGRFERFEPFGFAQGRLRAPFDKLTMHGLFLGSSPHRLILSSSKAGHPELVEGRSS